MQRFYHANKAQKKSRGRNVTALHIIQSFKGYECSPDEAHEIARQLVENQYGKHVQAVIATHIDRDNIHNHIMLNSVNFKGKKIYNDKRNRNELRFNSDELCRKYNLSVIEKPLNKSLKYNEWLHRKNNTSWKEGIRNDIDRAILDNHNWEDFVVSLRDIGYKVNNNPNRKYVTLAKEGFRPIRLKTLGYHYEEQSIKKRLIAPDKHYIDFTVLQNEREAEFRRQRQNFAAFVTKKRLEYSLANSVIALQYLRASEIIYRLIINNLMKRTVKFDIGSPYGLMNDYYFRQSLNKLVFVERHGVKTKGEYDLALRETRHKARGSLTSAERTWAIR